MVMNCDPRAYAQCPTRHLCGSLNDAQFMEGSDCDKFNQRILNQPMTYADRIRAMSDEEQCDAIFRLIYAADPATWFCKGKKECGDLMDANKEIPDEMCKACLLAKLREPVKEEPKLPSGFFLDKEESGLTEEA